MKYTLIFRWNGNIVMNASCTAVIACDMIRHYFDGVFAGADHKRFMESAPIYKPGFLDSILAMVPGDDKSDSFRDATGAAAFTLIR